jgi:hypothetical protein
MLTHNLSKAEFLAAHNDPMKPVDGDVEPAVDFWPYYAAIPDRDFGGFDRSREVVSYAYRDATERFEHVLVSTNDRNVFMVLVLAL